MTSTWVRSALAVARVLRLLAGASAMLTIRFARYVATLLFAFGILTAEYLQTFVGYTMAQLLVVVSVALLWFEGRRSHAPTPTTRLDWADDDRPVNRAISTVPQVALLLYLVGTMRWAIRANLELSKQQAARTLRRARRRLRMAWPQRGVLVEP